MKEVKIYGGYDKENNMYVARFTCAGVNSEVKGRTQNTKTLKETLGVIRAIEHAVSYCELGCCEYVIKHNSEYVRDMFASNFKCSYREIADARAYLRAYQKHIVYVGGKSNEK